MSTTRPIDWSRLPFGSGVKVLRKHPCGLAAVEKPAGVLSHPNEAADQPRSLLTARYHDGEQYFEIPDADGARIWLLHRLDGATSGVILLACDAAVAAAVRAAFEGRGVTKRYVAIVLGHPREKRALWRDNMQIRRTGGAVRAAERGGALAETAMRTLCLIPGPPALAALELEPHTGRTHQLRFQCARRKLPILGDQNYGNFRMNRELARRFGFDRLFLHARHIGLEFAAPSGSRIRFEAGSPLPREFNTFLPG
ncbi:MAG: RluA family pseudouridine synthase [Opitutaceae bacterium]